jgi:uncharacterized protein
MTDRQNPTLKSQRVVPIDALRGFALLGILLVNAAVFAMPISSFSDKSMEGLSTIDQSAKLFVSVFAELKFISIFSLLFGTGLAIQYERARKKKTPFFPFIYRRLAVLAIIGLCHGLFIWYGDVLFLYGCLGAIMVLLVRFSPKTMALIGINLLLIGGFLGMIFAALGAAFPTPLNPDAVAENITGFKAIMTTDLNIYHPTYIQAETAAHTAGPFIDALAFRATSWAFTLIIIYLFMAWLVAGMFSIGVALWKSGFFKGDGPGVQWRSRLLYLAVLIGVPLEFFQNFMVNPSSPVSVGLGSGAHMIGAPLVALGIVSLFMILGDRKLLPFAGSLAAVGRMSLTAYLMESFIFVFITDWWGLGLFGSLGYFQLLMISLGIYLGIVVFCLIWQRFSNIGPAEWIWRSVSYLRLPEWKTRPIRSEPASPE